MRPAGIAPTRQVASASAEAVAFVDTLRTHQQRYLESVGAAGAMLSDDAGQLAALAASTAQMTRQFFDAQRALLTRQASYDAQFADSRRRGDVDVDDPELLNLQRWDAAKATRQLAALLDGWWTALNVQGERMMDVTSARTALRRQVAAIDAGCPAQGPAAGNPLPGRLLGLLDQDRSPDLTGLLRSLLDALDAPGDIRPAFLAAVAAPIAPARRSSTFPPPCMSSVAASVAGSVMPQASSARHRHPQCTTPVAPVAVTVPAAVVASSAACLPAPTERVSDPGAGRDLTIRFDEPIDGERWLHRLEQLGHIDRAFWDDRDRGRTTTATRAGRNDRASSGTVDRDESGDLTVTTRIVLPMVAATLALTAVMAFVG